MNSRGHGAEGMAQGEGRRGNDETEKLRVENGREKRDGETGRRWENEKMRPVPEHVVPERSRRVEGRTDGMNNEKEAEGMGQGAWRTEKGDRISE